MSERSSIQGQQNEEQTENEKMLEGLKEEKRLSLTDPMSRNMSDLPWPQFFPFPDKLLDRFDKLYELESSIALPYKQMGNEAYKNRNFEEAMKWYKKALLQFTNTHHIVSQFLYGFLVGTVNSSTNESPVKLLSGFTSTIGKEIMSYFFDKGVCGRTFSFIPRRLISEIDGNMSIVCRMLGKPQLSLNCAKAAIQHDYTYAKGRDLLEKAVKSGGLGKSVKSDAVGRYIEHLKGACFMSKHIVSSLKAEHLGLLVCGDVLCHPLEFAVLEQHAMKSEIQRIRSSLLLHRTEEENVKCQLRVSLVPFDPLMCSPIGGGDRDGTYTHMCLKSEGAYDEEMDTFMEYSPGKFELSSLHFTCVDPDHGADCELPPNGRATPLAILNALKAIQSVVTKVKDYGFDVTQILMCQGLTEMAGPTKIIGEDADSLSEHSRRRLDRQIISARLFREHRFGSSDIAQGILSKWDDFVLSHGIKLATPVSTYASEKNAGYGFVPPDNFYNFEVVEARRYAYFNE